MMNPRKQFLLFVLLTLYRPVPAQETDPEIRLLQQLDSIAKSASPARHFATLYLETTGRAIGFYHKAEPGGKEFIKRLELNFAGYFLRAAGASPDEIAPVWKPYFSDSSLSVFQYQLLGINAHINGDIWQALVTEFSKEELLLYRKPFLRFQLELKIQFHRFYRENADAAPVTRFLHNSTAGLARNYGAWMLSHWRKRQYRLAVFHYTDPEKFRRLLHKITRKKERVDRLVFRHL